HYWMMWVYAQRGQRAQALQQYGVYEQLLWAELATAPGERLVSLRQQLEVQQIPAIPAVSTTSVVSAPPDPNELFCGREGELAQLRRLWVRTQTGVGHALLIEGEPGIGKSALVRTFTHALQPTAVVLQGTCYESTMAVVLAPWLPIIRQAIQTIQERQVGVPEVMLHRLRLVLPDLLPGAAEGVRGVVDHELDARLLLTTMVEVLTLVVRQTRTVLVLEDVHFADDFSVHLLTLVLQRLAHLPILVVVTQRSLEVQQNTHLYTALSEWERMRDWERLELVPLEVAAVVQVLEQLVPEVVDKPTVAERLLQHTMGVSLYLMEVVYACRVDPDLLQAFPVPPSFAKLVEQRLSSMTDPQRQTLEALAVFAFPATLPMLQACTTQSEEQLLYSLEYALGQRFIQELQEGPHTYYRLAHMLLQEVILDNLTEVRQQRLHRRSVAQLEKLALVLPEAKRAELISRLVYHAQRAGDVERLMRWVPVAAQAAKEAFAYRQALALYEDLDEVLQQKPNIEIEMYTRILLEMVDVLRPLGEWNVQEGVLQRIAVWYRNGLLTDIDLLKIFFIEYGANQRRLGNYSTAKAYLLQAVSFAEKSQDNIILAQSYHHLGLISYHQSDWDSAEAYYIQSLTLWESVDDDIAMSKLYNNLGALAYRKSNYDMAAEYFARNLTIREKYNDRHGMATSLNNLGAVCLALSTLDDAEHYYQRALDMRNELDDQDGIAVTTSNLADLCVLQNKLAEALTYYEQSLSFRQSIGDKTGMAHSLNGLGELYLYMEQFDTAIVHLTQSLDIRRDLGEKMGMAETLLHLSFAQSMLADRLLDDRFYEALEMGYTINSSYIMLLALTLFSIRLLHQHKDAVQAAQYAGLLDAHKPDTQRVALNQVLASLLEGLDQDMLRREMARGATLDVQEVVQDLLREHRR
ncbi:MAG: tetratricopeptide repeat protein, partial [Chloroflexota bacterium]